MDNRVTKKDIRPQIIAIAYKGSCGRIIIFNYLTFIIKKSNYFLFKI